MRNLNKIWRSLKCNVETMKRLPNTLIIPIALHRNESWTISSKHKKRYINIVKKIVFEMGALRKMLGINRSYKMRNVGIPERLGVKETLVQKVYQRQHTWLGNVRQMYNVRIVKFC